MCGCCHRPGCTDWGHGVTSQYFETEGVIQGAVVMFTSEKGTLGADVGRGNEFPEQQQGSFVSSDCWCDWGRAGG